MPTISVARGPTPPPVERARFDAQWLWPATAVVSVRGELDASNTAELTEYEIRHTRPVGKLVLDLSAVAFFGACCFAGLRALNVRCAAEHIDWVLVPSRSVDRVLGICDPAGALPTSSDLRAAVARLHNQPPQLQVVNQAR